MKYAIVYKCNGGYIAYSAVALYYFCDMETDTETSLQYLWDYMVDYHDEFGLAHTESERAHIFSNYDALLDAYIDLGGLACNGTATTTAV